MTKKNYINLQIEKLEQEILELRCTLDMPSSEQTIYYNLRRDALSADRSYVRLAALKELDDKPLWLRATNDEDDQIRVIALKRVNNRKMIEDAAINDESYSARLALLMYLNDDSVLKKTSTEDADPFLRDYAESILKIRSLVRENYYSEFWVLKVFFLLGNKCDFYSEIIELLEEAQDSDILAKRGDLNA